jgi:hypothetical protein
MTIKISQLAAGTITGPELLEVSQISDGSYTSIRTTAQNVAYAASRYGSFFDTTDQTGNTSAPTAVKFGTNDISTQGVTVVTNGSALTRITYADAGVYLIAPNLQFRNTHTDDHDVTIWLRINDTNVANSATIISVPKNADGGAMFFQIALYVTVTAGQYVEVMWRPEDAAHVTLDAAPSVTTPAVPAIPSAIVVTQRIALP